MTIIKVAVYVTLAVIAMILGGKTIKEEEVINPTYPKVQPTEEDLIFLESLQFWPNWREMQDDTLLGLKEESLDLIEEGFTLDNIKIGLLGRFLERDVDYFLGALTGIYQEQEPA